MSQKAHPRERSVCLFFYLFIPPFFVDFHSQRIYIYKERAREMDWGRKNTHVPSIHDKIAILAFILFTEFEIVNIVIVKYFTLSQSFVRRSDIIFSFWLVCVADCLQTCYCYTLALFPLFPLSIHIHSTSLFSLGDGFTFSSFQNENFHFSMLNSSSTCTHSVRGYECVHCTLVHAYMVRQSDSISMVYALEHPPRSFHNPRYLDAIFFLIYIRKKLCIFKFACNRREI